MHLKVISLSLCVCVHHDKIILILGIFTLHEMRKGVFLMKVLNVKCFKKIKKQIISLQALKIINMPHRVPYAMLWKKDFCFLKAGFPNLLQLTAHATDNSAQD